MGEAGPQGVHQQQEMGGELQFHSHLTVLERTFASLKAHNLKVHMKGTYYISPVTAWGACLAAVYGVTQSRTRLKPLSSSSSTVLYLVVNEFIFLIKTKDRNF